MEIASELKFNLTWQDVVSQYLTFTLGNEEYGVDILRVQEIRGWQDVMYQYG